MALVSPTLPEPSTNLRQRSSEERFGVDYDLLISRLPNRAQSLTSLVSSAKARVVKPVNALDGLSLGVVEWCTRTFYLTVGSTAKSGRDLLLVSV